MSKTEYGRRSRSAFEVSVLEDHVRGLPAELERYAFDRAGCTLHDEPTNLGRARERDLGDVRMLDQPLPDHGALPDEHVDDTFWNTGLEAKLAEPHCRERRQLRRLEDDGVPARKCGPQLPARDVGREVPGDDQADDSERLSERCSDSARDRDRLTEVLVDRAGIEMEHLGDHADLTARPRDRLAHVARFDARELLGVLFDERREPPEQARAITWRNVAPWRKGTLRASDCLVSLLDAGLLQLGDRLLGGGVDNRERHGLDSNT